MGLAQTWRARSHRRDHRRRAGRHAQCARGRGRIPRNPVAADRRAACRRAASRCIAIIRTIRARWPTIRLNYPKISAVAGPCGLWPEDLGPSIKNKSYFENKSYYNFGCAYQRNMAAMVDNPADLVQPRPETPAYTVAAHGRLREVSQGQHHHDHLSRSRQGQTQRYRQMISYARQNPEEQPDVTPPPRTIISRRRRGYPCRPFARRWKPRLPCNRRAKTAASARPISRSRWAAWPPPSRPIAPRRRRT